MKKRISLKWSAIAVIALAAFINSCGKDAEDTPAPADPAGAATPAAAVPDGDVEYEGPAPGAVPNDDGPVRPGTVYTTNVQGDPYTEGQTFTIDVALKGDDSPIIQAYQMRLAYDDTIVSLERIEDVDLGGSPPALGKRYGQDSGVESGVEQSFGTLGNFDNKQTSMTFCRLYFDVLTTPDGPYSIRLMEDPPNEVLIAIDFKGVPYVFDDSATAPMPRP